MGLLDDAIREHLDLKRARGGDPAEIEKMEREALGPVRREPTIGSSRFEAAGEHAPLAPESGYPDDRDQLPDPGYHDSMAPHAHPGHAHGDPFDSGVDEHEQPRRRFLRRNRSAASDASQGSSVHEDPFADPRGPLDHDDLLEHHELAHHEDPAHHEPLVHEPLEHEPLKHEPLEHHDVGDPRNLSEHHESLAHHDLHEHDDPLEHQEHPGASAASQGPAEPPHLQFDQPPKRPRFSAEPPSLHPEAASEADTAAHQAAPPAQPAAPAAEAQEDSEVQETTEFDVQKHIAETRFQPDEETQVHRPAPPAPTPQPPAEEDVLEETPEFLQDAPEHDRLWFEQRPPRDFDFDG